MLTIGNYYICHEMVWKKKDKRLTELNKKMEASGWNSIQKNWHRWGKNGNSIFEPMS